jgi:choline dehydrogenase-like flavoprotein
VREAFIAGAVGVGIPRCEDYNSGDHQEGVGYFQRAIYRGYRHSAARVFLHPAGATGQLEVRTDSRAAQILFDGTRAVGVRYVDDRDRTVQRGGRLGHAEHAVREYLFSTVMIAEKASDMIRGRPPLAPVEGIAA